MHLTRTEARIKSHIENSRKLNPDELDAHKWLEASEWSQSEIARRVGISNYTLVNTLCRKLGVKRDLRRRRDSESIYSRLLALGPVERREQARKARQGDLLRQVRRGDSSAGGKLLKEFGIKFTRGEDYKQG